MKWLPMGFVVVLAGCASQETNVRAVRVEMPVMVLCKTQKVTAPSWVAVGLKK